jgi:hypothetical protein
MGILTDKASIFCLVVLHIILTLFDLRQNSLSVGFNCVMEHAFGTLSGRQRKKARQRKPSHFGWIKLPSEDKAS